jgi:hypothetical protein
MHTRSVTKIVLAVVMAMASTAPTLAAHRSMHTPKPCAIPEQRCIADCDKDHWCHKYQCINNATVLLPFSCLETTGTCFAPHC